MAKMAKMAKRLGYVSFTRKYAVDLNDADMVEYAKECIFDDLTSMMKYNEGIYCEEQEDISLTEADLIEDPFVEVKCG